MDETDCVDDHDGPDGARTDTNPGPTHSVDLWQPNRNMQPNPHGWQTCKRIGPQKLFGSDSAVIRQ